MTVRSPGLGRLLRDLRRMGAALKALEPVNQVAARLAVSRARPPRRTGALDRSLVGDVTAHGWAITTDKPYGRHVHNGTERMEAHPFATQAIEESQATWLQLYRTHADKARDLVAGKRY